MAQSLPLDGYARARPMPPMLTLTPPLAPCRQSLSLDAGAVASPVASSSWRIGSGADYFHRAQLHLASTHGRAAARTLRQGKLHWDQPPENVLLVKKVPRAALTA
jgi:hypothetical protein